MGQKGVWNKLRSDKGQYRVSKRSSKRLNRVRNKERSSKGQIRKGVRSMYRDLSLGSKSEVNQFQTIYAVKCLRQ